MPGIKAIAESSAVMVMVRILRATALFGCCMTTLRFIMLHIEDSFDLKQPHRMDFPAGLLSYIFFHPDYTVGCGVLPHRVLLRFADYTAGQEIHLATKMLN